LDTTTLLLWWCGQFFAYHLTHCIDHRTLLDKRYQRVIDQGLIAASSSALNLRTEVFNRLRS
jgi:hypothetical protein